MDVNKNIAINIKRYREAMGLTQKELAEKLSFSPDTIQKWEVGKNRVYPEYLYDLCKIFGIGMEDMMFKTTKSMKDALLIDDYRYDSSYPEAKDYVGIDNVAEAFLDYMKERNKILPVHYVLEENIGYIREADDILYDNDYMCDNWDYEKFDDWEGLNRFIISYNTEDDEIYAIRDYGKYSPDYEDYFLTTNFVPIEVPMRYNQKLEKNDDVWLSDIKTEILKRRDNIKSFMEEEMQKARAAKTEGKNTIFVIAGDSYGHVTGYDIDEGRAYYVERFESSPDSFYVRPVLFDDSVTEILDENGEGSGCELERRGDNRFTLYFPDPLHMVDIGATWPPKSFNEMMFVPEYHHELKKDYDFHSDFDKDFEEGMALMNFFVKEKPEEYAALRTLYDEMNTLLGEDKEDEITDEMKDKYREGIKTLKKVFFSKYFLDWE